MVQQPPDLHGHDRRPRLLRIIAAQTAQPPARRPVRAAFCAVTRHGDPVTVHARPAPSLLPAEKVLSAAKRMRWKGHGFFSAAGRALHIPRHLIRCGVAAVAPVMRSPCAYAQIFLLPSGRAVTARPIILRTNAKTVRGKCSRMHNLENHSQKGLYKCGFLWYLHISNNSCY